MLENLFFLFDGFSVERYSEDRKHQNEIILIVLFTLLRLREKMKVIQSG